MAEFGGDTGAREAAGLAREVTEWLRQNDEGVFHITCQRCGAPFEHEGQAVAAPPEWYGGLDFEKRLAEHVVSLVASLARVEEERDEAREALVRAADALEQIDGLIETNSEAGSPEWLIAAVWGARAASRSVDPSGVEATLEEGSGPVRSGETTWGPDHPSYDEMGQ